jgi:hypothetical protein
MPRPKRVSLLLLAGVLVSLVFLGGSLSNLQLLPGSPVPGGIGASTTSVPSTPSSTAQLLSIPLLRGILALAFFGLLVFLSTRILVLADWGLILRLAAVLAVLLVLIWLLPRLAAGGPSLAPGSSTGLATPPSSAYPVSPLGQPPELLSQLVILGMGLGLVALTFVLLKAWPGQRLRTAGPLEREVEQAERALKSGGELGEVIVQCYQQMCRYLQQERGIERDRAMTVEEFEETLSARGFPKAPVRSLTRLFERARYGTGNTTGQDEAQALRSLNAILQHCRGMREDA